MAVRQLRVGEIVLAEQVNVRPGHGGVSFDGEEQVLPLSGVCRSEPHLEYAESSISTAPPYIGPDGAHRSHALKALEA